MRQEIIEIVHVNPRFDNPHASGKKVPERWDEEESGFKISIGPGAEPVSVPPMFKKMQDIPFSGKYSLAEFPTKLNSA